MDAGEQTYKLQYHKRGLFQQWVTVFVVIDGYSIRKYPDEKRSAKRCKEILLYDAAFSHSTVWSNSKRPYCVFIRSGPSMKEPREFVFSLASRVEESRFLSTLLKYLKIAMRNAPTESPDESSLVC